MRRAEELAGDLAVIRASWGARREPAARRLGLPRSVPGRLALAAAAGAIVAVALRLGPCRGFPG
jgi:hypothetical protein